MTTTTIDRVRWGFADTLVLVGRQLMRVRRQPGELIGALIFPALMVVMFGYIFGSAIKVPGGGNYREYLMPGLFAMTALTSVMATSVLTATDAARGVMDRLRSMPVVRSAVPIAQAGFDVVGGLISMTIMAGLALLVGWSPHRGLALTAAGFGLIVLMRCALSWAGIYLGLRVKNEETADQLVPLIFPISMTSNSFVPTDGMPAWLRVISNWNPVSALVAALRDLFGNPGAPTASAAWPEAHPIMVTLGWSAVLFAVFVPLAVRAYRTKNR
jgi:ABC-2 type transport system permease protein